jgi:hypothetical protein
VKRLTACAPRQWFNTLCRLLYRVADIATINARTLTRGQARLLAFTTGSLGSWAAAHAYDRWGWTGACLAAAAFPAVGLLGWLGAGRHERKKN